MPTVIQTVSINDDPLVSLVGFVALRSAISALILTVRHIGETALVL